MKLLPLGLSLAGCDILSGNTVFSCWGTVEVTLEGKQINEHNQPYSIAVLVNIEKKMLTVNEEQIPIIGNPSTTEIIANDDNKGKVFLNRITGEISAYLIEINNFKTFHGKCEPAKRMF
jgi:hypothetical protein